MELLLARRIELVLLAGALLNCGRVVHLLLARGPVFNDLLLSMNVELAAPTRGLLWLSETLRGHLWLALTLTAVLTWYALLKLPMRLAFKSFRHRKEPQGKALQLYLFAYLLMVNMVALGLYELSLGALESPFSLLINSVG
jgi:type II secretory pathway component PulF